MNEPTNKSNNMIIKRTADCWVARDKMSIDLHTTQPTKKEKNDTYWFESESFVEGVNKLFGKIDCREGQCKKAKVTLIVEYE